MNIKTSRLVIRELQISDLDAFHAYRSNQEVAKFQGYEAMDLQEAESFIRKNARLDPEGSVQWVQYGIEQLETSKLIGDCGIRLESGLAEIGITISPLHQKQGFAREAMKGVLDFLFRKRNVEEVVERVDTKNEASVNLLKSLNFRKKGWFKDLMYKGQLCDEFEFVLSKADWDHGNLQK
ncbi:GNAT family N-acetyltransferase [Salinimicrobium oceani]|uniref:GNAT family N-acetyltransferase n=1 Tax=Salinimicrobium oceani TaxID=2722702 RepID=A0ABX1D4E6_9FLAO|nr:GNAT family N-acetyltransferase [Salinimicrobium oceani]NJW54058.1 GNAT family N-acetyltransferase [Salinimicrobium oceani]